MNRQQLNSLSKCARFALVASLLLLSSRVLHAAPIVPGGVFFPAIAEPDPVGATLVFSTGPVPFSAATFSGDLRSSVWKNDAANPFGPNALTFVYEIINAAGSPDAINRLSVSSFDGFLTDVSYTPVPGSTAPTYISRSVNGDVVGFGFLLPALAPNTNSTPLVVQTNAPVFAPTLASLIDGSVTMVASVAPIGIPEPATFCLFVGGLMLLASPRHRKPC
jgi:hypothetical protein